MMAADWMVMPRSRSMGRKSVVVLPWSTSGGHQPLVHSSLILALVLSGDILPRWRVLPLWYSIRSVVVVLPCEGVSGQASPGPEQARRTASTWAMMPMLRMLSVRASWWAWSLE